MDILLGLQWGDEGKGKIVDVLSPKYDLVARFQGGPNAGHTLEFDRKKLVLHQIPSGILHKDIANIVGNGVVLDPIIFKNEIDAIGEFGVDVNANLSISRKVHLILPTHRILDAASEKSKGDQKIGSTLKGIGPTYRDKTGRQGVRLGDAIAEGFEAKYQSAKEWHMSLLKIYGYDIDELAKMFRKNKSEEFYTSFEEIEKDFFGALDFLKSLNVVDSEYEVNSYLQQNKKVLAEGAQGTLLDIDMGSYPFVTSSNTFAAGASVGLGVAPNKIKEVYGIFKAYCTRVGSGPFPTELEDATREELRKCGHEFGATTGRPRRCGWLDLPALKYAVMINGVTQLFITKADVLNTFDEIKVCTHYQLADGAITDQMPFDLCTEDVKPVYKAFEGWKSDLSKVESYDELPSAFKAYLKYIEVETGVPITIVSVGPDRTETIFRDSMEAVTA